MKYFQEMIKALEERELTRNRLIFFFENYKQKKKKKNLIKIMIILIKSGNFLFQKKWKNKIYKNKKIYWKFKFKRNRWWWAKDF